MSSVIGWKDLYLPYGQNSLMITKLNLLVFLKFLGYGRVYHYSCPHSEKEKVLPR